MCVIVGRLRIFFIGGKVRNKKNKFTSGLQVLNGKGKKW